MTTTKERLKEITDSVRNKRYTLSYVNEAETTTDYDLTFETMPQLLKHVWDHHGTEWTSYQIIVTRTGK